MPARSPASPSSSSGSVLFWACLVYLTLLLVHTTCYPLPHLWHWQAHLPGSPCFATGVVLCSAPLRRANHPLSLHNRQALQQRADLSQPSTVLLRLFQHCSPSS